MVGARELCRKSPNSALLCAASVFSVSLWCVFARNSSTTETQRTQRLHREISEPGLLRQSRAPATTLGLRLAKRLRRTGRNTNLLRGAPDVHGSVADGEFEVGTTGAGAGPDDAFCSAASLAGGETVEVGYELAGAQDVRIDVAAEAGLEVDID